MMIHLLRYRRSNAPRALKTSYIDTYMLLYPFLLHCCTTLYSSFVIISPSSTSPFLNPWKYFERKSLCAGTCVSASGFSVTACAGSNVGGGNFWSVVFRIVINYIHSSESAAQLPLQYTWERDLPGVPMTRSSGASSRRAPCRRRAWFVCRAPRTHP